MRHVFGNFIDTTKQVACSSIDKCMLCNRPYLYVKGLTLLLHSSQEISHGIGETLYRIRRWSTCFCLRYSDLYIGGVEILTNWSIIFAMSNHVQREHYSK